MSYAFNDEPRPARNYFYPVTREDAATADDNEPGNREVSPDVRPSTKRQTHAATPAELDSLFQRTIALPPYQLREHLERFVGRPETARAGLRVSERRVSTERFPDRNAEIRQRHARGESYGQLAMDTGLSRSRIAQIVQAGRAKSVQEFPGYTAQLG